MALSVHPSLSPPPTSNPPYPSPISLSLRSPTTPRNPPPDHNKLVISGGACLSGHVHISGSKNAALAVLAASLCCSGTSSLHRVPDISDTRTMLAVLRSLGARVEDGGASAVVTVNADHIGSLEPCAESVARIRAGFLVLGPLLARFGEAVVALPGGCDIGARPVDLHIRGLRALGAFVELRNGKVYACTANGRGLVGGRFSLDYPSVGATETLMMAASIAEGETILSNVAQEPEVTDLAEFLIAGGASIQGVGSNKLVIGGRKRLHDVEFTLIPDRIEAGTFMVAAAITRSCISMSPIIPSHLTSVMNKLLNTGCKIMKKAPNNLEVLASPTICDEMRGVSFKTCPFPGFPTDLQPQFAALLTTCNGSCVVEETVFDDRMGHVKELKKLGAKFLKIGSSVIVYGGSKLHGSQVVASDLRGGVSLVLAGMAAEGITEISGASHIDRGYENLEGKLLSLGANIRRLPYLSDALCASR